MTHYLIYQGRCSRDFGIYISGENTFGSPEKDIESIEIPGRNGNLTISRGRFKNITVSYPVFIRRDFTQNAAAARAWLLGAEGYARLEDTYHPDSFRLAQFMGPIDFEMHCLNRSGTASLSFDCKPQRFLKCGEAPMSCTWGGSIYNSGFPALPLIRVSGTGAGNLYIGKYTVVIKSIDDYVMLDSDTQNAYKGTINKNSTISAPEFPVLEPGENGINWSGGITSVEIIPRWWTV